MRRGLNALLFAMMASAAIGAAQAKGAKPPCQPLRGANYDAAAQPSADLNPQTLPPAWGTPKPTIAIRKDIRLPNGFNSEVTLDTLTLDPSQPYAGLKLGAPNPAALPAAEERCKNSQAKPPLKRY